MTAPQNFSLGTKGTDLQFTASTSAFASIAQIKSIDGPGMKVGTRDVTTLQSTAGEFLPSIGKAQELSGTMVYTPKDANVVLFASRTTTLSSVFSASGLAGLDEFKIIMPTTTMFFRFYGFVTSFVPKGGDEEGTWMADFSIQPSGSITYPTTA